VEVIEIKAGERRRIMRVFFSSVPMTYQFRAEPLEGDDGVSGTVEVKGSNWVFPKLAVTKDLEEDNAVDKGAWDTFFGVTVVPDADVRIFTEERAMRSIGIFAAIIGAIVVLAVVVVVLASL
jgi:fumarylacetoacetate (FAA) hydrolase family protein